MNKLRTRGMVSTMGLLLLLVAGTPALSVTGGWSPPFNLSEWHQDVPSFRLAVGSDGTQAAFWQVQKATVQWSLGVRVRPPGEEWGPQESFTGPQAPFADLLWYFWDAGVAPDGTAWAVWAAIDSGQVGDNVQVWASHLPPGPGGSWHTEALTSGYETSVPWVDLHVGPDGNLAAAWVACASSQPYQGPCHVRVRRRPAGASNWEPLEQPDQAVGDGIREVSVLVGPGGLTVVLWKQAIPPTPYQEAIMARAFEPASGTWDPGPTNVSGWKSLIGMAWPVMDPAGTVIVAWNSPAADPSKWAIYASTRPAASGVWSASPAQLSSAHSTGVYPPRLAVGQNGTVAAVWAYEPTATEHYVLANARDAGSTWGAEALLSGGPGWQVTYWYLQVAVWPDGTAMALYGIRDTHRPETEDERLHWVVRSAHGAWGGGGQGELGDWVDRIGGPALAAGADGRATAVWGLKDAGGPAGEQWTVLAATWPPGGPFDPPVPIAEWYPYTEPAGLIVGPEGQPVAAAWFGQRATDGFLALFYNELLPGGWRIYLPMVIRSS